MIRNASIRIYWIFYLEPANGDILFIAKPKTDDVEHGGKERSDPAISVRARRFKEGFLFDSLIYPVSRATIKV